MVDSNVDHMLLQSFWQHQNFNNDTLLLKRLNIKNEINHFSQCAWFGTLCSMGGLPSIWKQIIFYGWRDFLTWPMSSVIFWKLQWIISQQNMGTWCSDTAFLEFQTTVHHHHPTKYWHLVLWHCDYLFWECQTTGHRHNLTKSGHLVQCPCDFLF